MVSHVVNSQTGPRLVVRPVRRPKYSLSGLLRRVTSRNMHDEIATGEPVGREVW